MPWRDVAPAPQAPAAPSRGQWRDAPISGGNAFLAGLGDSALLGWSDELQGLGAGIGASLQGRDFNNAYNQRVNQARTDIERAQQDNPAMFYGGEGVGFFAPGLGWAKAAKTAGQGLRAASTLGRIGRAAAVGAGIGAVSTAGESTDPLAERGGAAARGALFGAPLGAAAHGILGEALPALTRQGRRLAGLPQESGRMGVAERAIEDLTHAARQNERLNVQSPNDLTQVMQQAAAQDPSMTVAEALGRSAINRVVKYSRLPGRTAELAERNLERNADTFDALTNRLDQTLTPRTPTGEPLTVRGANGELDAAFAQTSTEGYQRALANRMSDAQATRMQALLRRHPEFYKRAINEAQMIARGEGADGWQGLTDPRLYHYLKVGAGDVLRTMKREGLGATLARQYTGSIRQLTNILDEVPGYRDARVKWGSLAEARDALDAGFSFDRMQPADLNGLMQHLTPFQQRYLQAGVSARIRDVLERRDNDGLVNIARDLTNRRRSDLVRTAFGDKPGAIDDFLRYARLRRQMHSDAARMASSRESPTGIVTGEGLASAIPTGAISLKAGALRLAYQNTIGRLGERNRDVLGRILLTPVGEFDRAGTGLLSRASREARRREAQRINALNQAALMIGYDAGMWAPALSQDKQR